tara:strand:+ start:42095 stop:42487 length:393 start_codon:yes stop_codon:yes gene_type:complete
MKPIATLIIMFFTPFCFSQNSGLIVGNVLDGEMNDAPLMYAKISIKDTALETTTDLSGLFLFENLKDGDYTLVCSFTGYDTKEVNVKIASGEPTDTNVTLNASTISLNDFAPLGLTAQNQEADKSVSVLN